MLLFYLLRFGGDIIGRFRGTFFCVSISGSDTSPPLADDALEPLFLNNVRKRKSLRSVARLLMSSSVVHASVASRNVVSRRLCALCFFASAIIGRLKPVVVVLRFLLLLCLECVPRRGRLPPPSSLIRASSTFIISS